MKKFIALMLVVLYCAPAFGTNGPTTKTLIVEGKFLTEKAATVRVQLVKDDSTTVDVRCDKTPKHFSATLEKGNKYKLTFTSRSGVEKSLYIEATEAGYCIQIDVDFSTDNSAEIVFHRGRYTTRLTREKEPFYVRK